MSTATVPEVRRSPLRMLAAGCMLAFGIAILAFAMSGSNAANRDFISYWAAGHQLAHHANPYDGAAIPRLEHTAGTDVRPYFMRNPPTAFFLALPLGFVGARAGVVLWSLALVAALMYSIRTLWTLNGRPEGRVHLVGYCFAPVLACLLAGQIGIFLLLGVMLFLRFHQTRPMLAGASLLLCALKPHLFLPFAIALLAWAIYQRAWLLLAGATGALAASALLGLALDPHGWQHYAAMAARAKMQNEFVPTLSLIFRLLIHRQAIWLQFVPAAIACIWAMWFYRKHRDDWNWMDHGMLLLLISVMAAPYAWFSDEAVVLPAILCALSSRMRSGRSMLPFSCLLGAALIEVLAGVGINTGFYIWTAPAWLALWLIRFPITSGDGQGDRMPALALRESPVSPAVVQVRSVALLSIRPRPKTCQITPSNLLL
jgi:Glycosyltransferase family 87